LNWILGGWQFNGIVQFQSGVPILITQGANNVGLFNPSQRPEGAPVVIWFPPVHV
jgi:hypothetical protein